MKNYKEEILRLKKEKNAAILAHYYVRDDIQELADYVGDSYYLSKIGLELDCEIIVFCGVSFMAECAKILSPNKKVLLPNTEAKCSMAKLASQEDVISMKKKHKNAKVVSYVNSLTEVKAVSDACCTSSNAYNVIKNIDANEIIFIPDKHLGNHVQEKFPDKKLILWDGSCNVHDNISAKDILNYKEKFNSKLIVLVHPECKKEVRDLANFIGSTGQIIDYIGKCDSKDFLVITEDGILYELKNRYPNKRFHSLNIICNSMKCITLKDLYNSLLLEKNEIVLEESLRVAANKSLLNMLELATR